MNVLLGKLACLEWKADARSSSPRGRRTWTNVERAPALVVVRDRLVIVYRVTVVAKASVSERAKYAKLHWGLSGDGDVLEGDTACAPLRVLGEGTSITYTTKKLGDGRGWIDYVHTWGEGARGKWRAPLVVEHRCGTPRCAGLGRLALRGGTYRVETRGIVG